MRSAVRAAVDATRTALDDSLVGKEYERLTESGLPTCLHAVPASLRGLFSKLQTRFLACSRNPPRILLWRATRDPPPGVDPGSDHSRMLADGVVDVAASRVNISKNRCPVIGA